MVLIENQRTHEYVPYWEDRVGLSKDKVCITTAIDRTKTSLPISFVLKNLMLTNLSIFVK